MELENYVEKIKDYWNSSSKEYLKTHPEHLDSSMHPSWGLWHIPEETLKIIHHIDLESKKVVDLGCGRGHDTVAYAKLGAYVIGVDISEEQLKGAIPHPNVEYVCACAESLPVADSDIDLIVSDHGAFDHSPAPILLQEMHRVLKDGGDLIVCTYSPLAYSCHDRASGKIGKTLVNRYPKGDIKFDGKLIVPEYSYQDWISFFRRGGFEIQRLEEITVPPEATSFFSDMVDTEWATNWPCDIIWHVRKIGDRK